MGISQISPGATYEQRVGIERCDFNQIGTICVEYLTKIVVSTTHVCLCVFYYVNIWLLTQNSLW